jgi:hypothetical protein
MSRAKYYWRQADICVRLSLLSNDGAIAELLINKAMELMSQAETAAAEDDRLARTGADRPDSDRSEPH